MKKEQVLLIEDDADIREGVRILLESENKRMTGKCAVMKEKNGFRITILFPVADS